MLKKLQHQFLQHILGDHRQNFPAQIAEQGELSNQQRLSIYSSAYQLRLKESIDTDHQVLGVYLGDELFDQMVDGYIKKYPSDETSLRYFAEKLPDFLAEESPFCDVPVIAELASFERHLLASFDAADHQVSSREEMALIPPENWPSLKFIPHPSLRLFTATHNSIEIWQAISQQTEVPLAQKTPDAYWLIWRNQQRLTEFQSLDPIQFELFLYILNQRNFSQICEMLSEFYPADALENEILNHLNMLVDKQLIQFNC